MSDCTVDTTRDSIIEQMRLRDRFEEERDRRYATEFRAIRDATAVAMAASQKANEKAEAAQQLRNEAMNEWRSAMADKDRNFYTRVEAVQLNEKIAALSSRMDRNDGKGVGLGAGWGYLVGAAGLLSAIVALFFAFQGATP